MHEIDTVAEAREFIKTHFDDGQMVVCPCCTQKVKKYAYNMGSIYIQQLTHLVLDGGWVKGTDLIFNTVGGYRKYAFLRWWRLATEDNGYFKATPLGRDFINGRALIPRTIVLFNNTLIATSEDDLVKVHQCLLEYFNFDELMDPASVRHIT
tara:strand:- start:29 stop:484 length:456 start_codon:yes stop_codon:yes gene_type:complete